MDAATFRDHCLAKRSVTEGTPFGPDVVVFKVSGKMFALLAPDDVPPTATLKCDPDLALQLRDRYEQVRPGYHMNKKHWNTVELGTGVPDAEIRSMIDHSYDLVVQSLPRVVAAAVSGGRPDKPLPRETAAATTTGAARRGRSPNAKRRARR
jgi:predicted DNA-binding protein (MmcQ/YjbR family)